MLKKYWPQLFFLLLVISIFATNYTLGTYLTGWDALHPEFNFSLNIKRSIFSLWQEYQGLGLLGGMGHAADLPRQILLWVTSLVVPNSLLRYLFHFLMLYLGVVGVYQLIKDYISNHQTNADKKTAGIFGALFYLLNLGTIQYFYVPFEPYSTFWGLLPWEIYVLLRYLNNPNKRNLLILAFINLLAVPQAYVQTIFLVYCLIVAIFLFFHVRDCPRRGLSLKNSLKVILVIFAMNAFWLLPNLYFVKNNLSINQNAKQNLMATDKFFLMNKARGNITDFIFLKEFYYDFVDYNQERSEFGRMMEPWRTQFDKPAVQILLAIFFILALLGFFTNKNYRKELLVIFLISCIAFLANDFPFSKVNDLLRQSLFINQLFRNPFTKFIVPTVLTLSILFSNSVVWTVQKLNKKITNQFFLYGCILGAFLYSFYPVWTGNFIYKAMRVKIPSSYFELFDYFKKDDNKGDRIANFPQSNIWGWLYYDWGLRGSGFMWYGIEQPILDRAFDVWSNTNENYYWEISRALYASDLDYFEKVFDKYQITHLLIDNSIFSYSNYKTLYISKLNDFVAQSNKFTFDKKFGPVSIYKVSLNKNINNYLKIDNNINIVGPSYKANDNDQAYIEYGDYQSTHPSKNSGQAIYYPFRSIFTGKGNDFEFTVESNTDFIIFKTQIPKELVGGSIVIPASLDEEAEMGQTIYLDGELIPWEENAGKIEINLLYIKNGVLEIRIPKVAGDYSFDSDKTGDLFIQEAKNCDRFNNQESHLEKVKTNDKNYLRFTSKSSSNCIALYLLYPSQRLGYLVEVNHRNIEGQSLLFSIGNRNSFHTDQELFLDLSKNWKTSYLIQPPMDKYGLGYDLLFDNISIGDVQTVNDLRRVTMEPIPYHFLTSLKIIKGQSSQTVLLQGQSPTGTVPSVVHPNPSYYAVSIKRQESSIKNQGNIDNNYLVLSQSFDKGWKAYEIKCQMSNIKCQILKMFPFIFGKELKEHVLVNNWENGWRLSTINDQQPTTIIVFYLPQLLEYLGFGLLGISILYLLLIKQKKTL